jgi:hypothetical protein
MVSWTICIYIDNWSNIPDYGGPIYIKIHTLEIILILIPALAISKNMVPQHFQLKFNFTHKLQSERCSRLQEKYNDINLFINQYQKRPK